MTLVVDASTVVAWLVDSDADGTWANDLIARHAVAAPHLLPVEVTNVLRRAVLHGDISADTGALAQADLMDLRIELFAFEPFAVRVWELRDNVTAYDAWYVALAEWLGTGLATLDRKLRDAYGPRCAFESPTYG